MECGYCDKPITDKRYVWKWFPSESVMKPVHNSHFDVLNKPHKKIYFSDIKRTERSDNDQITTSESDDQEHGPAELS